VSTFEFVFSLVGLVLGLSFVEILGGLVRAIKGGAVKRTNLLAIMLGFWVLLDVTSFWGMVWGVREDIDAANSIWLILGAGALITSVYYVAASLVFPDQLDKEVDLKVHYWRRKRTVAALIWLCELAAMATNLAFSDGWSVVIWLINGTLLFLAALLWWSRMEKVDAVVLCALIANGVCVFVF